MDPKTEATVVQNPKLVTVLELTDEIEVKKEKYLRKDHPAVNSTCNIEELIGELKKAREATLDPNEVSYQILQIAEQILENEKKERDEITAKEFVNIVHLGETALLMGVDIGERGIEDTNNLRIRLCARYRQPEELEGICEPLESVHVNQEDGYYRAIQDQIPLVLEAFRNSAGIAEFIDGFLIKFYHSEFSIELIGGVKSEKELPEGENSLSVELIREKLSVAREMWPDRTEEFYSACELLLENSSPDLVQPKPIDERLANLGLPTYHQGEEEELNQLYMKRGQALIDLALEEASGDTSQLLERLRELDKVFTDLERIDFELRVLADYLEYEKEYYKEVHKGELDPSALFYFALMSVADAREISGEIGGSPLQGLNLEGRHKVVGAILTELASELGSEGYQQSLQSKIETHFKCDNLSQKGRDIAERLGAQEA